MEGEGEEIREEHRKKKCIALNIFLRALHAAMTLWQCSLEENVFYSLFLEEEQLKISCQCLCEGAFFISSVVARQLKPIQNDWSHMFVQLFFLSLAVFRSFGGKDVLKFRFGRGAPLLCFAAF